MKLFFTSCLLLLLVPLALSSVITKKQAKIKLIYDQGLFLSETRGWDGFWFNTHFNLVTDKDGKVFKNGTSVILLSAMKSSSIYDDTMALLRLERDSEHPSLDALSFALESISGNKDKCDVAPAFKNLTYKCEGSIRVRELTGEEKSKAQERRQQLVASLEAKKRQFKGADELGEFRLLVDDETETRSVIAEAIGVFDFVFGKSQELTYLDVWNDEEMNDEEMSDEPKFETGHKEMNLVKGQGGSFAIENILGASKQKDCEQSPLKDWIKIVDCKLAELRALTEEEKSRLRELKGSM